MRQTRPRPDWLPRLTLLLAAAAGCGEGFPPENRIQELRVLAIKSEPVAPAPGETTTLSALVYTPEPDPTLTYAWSWCPLPGAPNAGYPCLIDEAQLAAMAASAGQPLPPYQLGNGPTVQLPHTVNPAILQQLCAAAAGMVIGGKPLMLDCEGGFPVQIKLTVKTATDEVVAIRRLRLRLGPGGEPNSNPRLDGIAINLPDPAGQPQLLPIDDMNPQQVFRSPKTTKLKASVPLESSEPYTGKDNDQRPVATRERLSLIWFVETGDTEDEETNYADGLSTLEKATENEWEPARRKDYPKTTARLFVVLKDNRDGVTWRSATVNLEDAP